MSASLAVVATNPAPEAETTSAESLTDRIRRLQEEARSMAREHIAQLDASMAATARLAAEIAQGGDVYPVGIREMARQMIADCEARQLGLQAILQRSGNVH